MYRSEGGEYPINPESLDDTAHSEVEFLLNILLVCYLAMNESGYECGR
jgi:hypothetical protein